MICRRKLLQLEWPDRPQKLLMMADPAQGPRALLAVLCRSARSHQEESDIYNVIVRPPFQSLRRRSLLFPDKVPISYL